MDVDDFSATARLDDGALHALLASERAEHRVWAAWRIALRAGSAMPDVVAHVQGEPSAGVRRALLVILAGHGELDVLVALARHDPSEDVRAHAFTFVARLAGQGAIAPAVVVEAFASASPAIRCAILAGVPPGAIDELRALVLEALAHGAPAEQPEAFEAALRVGDAETRAAAMRWLGAVKGAFAADGWRRLQERPHDEIVELVYHTTFAMRARALLMLTGVPVAALARLAVDGHPRTFEIIGARHDFDDAPAALLARAILSGCAVGFVERLTAQLGAAASVPADLEPLMPRLRDHVRDRLTAVATGQHAPPERPPWRWPAIQRYQELLAQIDRLATWRPPILR